MLKDIVHFDSYTGSLVGKIAGLCHDDFKRFLPKRLRRSVWDLMNDSVSDRFLVELLVRHPRSNKRYVPIWLVEDFNVLHWSLNESEDDDDDYENNGTLSWEMRNMFSKHFNLQNKRRKFYLRIKQVRGKNGRR